MFETEIWQLEFLIQLLWTVPFTCFAWKIAGFRKWRFFVPSYVVLAVFYFSWKLSSEIATRWPEMISGDAHTILLFRTAAIIGFMVLTPFLLDGSYLKGFLFFLVGEFIGLLSYLMRATGMLFLRWSGLYALLAAHLPILAVVRIALEFVPIWFVLWLFRKPFQYYHDHEIQKKGLGWALVAFLLCLELFGLTGASHPDLLASVRILTGSLVVCAVCAVLGYYQKKEMERSALRQRLMENHYETIQNETQQMDAARRSLRALTEMAGTLNGASGSADVARYVEELKKIHKKLQRVEYCDNLLLDAMLHNKELDARARGVTLAIDMNGSAPTKRSATVLFEILGDLLDAAIAHAASCGDPAGNCVSVAGRTAAGRLIVEIDSPARSFAAQGKESSAGNPSAAQETETRAGNTLDAQEGKSPADKAQSASAQKQARTLRRIGHRVRRLGGWCRIERPSDAAGRCGLYITVSMTQ